MSLALTITLGGSQCFPRVSGDEPFTLTLTRLLLPFSPRERG